MSVNYFYCTVSIHKMDVFSVCAAYLSYAMNINPGLKLYFFKGTIRHERLHARSKALLSIEQRKSFLLGL